MWGRGVLYYKDPQNSYGAERFEGEFRYNGEFKGKVFLKNGDRYEGLFQPEEAVRGKIFFHNGDFYDGGVVRFQMYRKGKIVYADGSEYEGDFLSNERFEWQSYHESYENFL